MCNLDGNIANNNIDFVIYQLDLLITAVSHLLQFLSIDGNILSMLHECKRLLEIANYDRHGATSFVINVYYTATTGRPKYDIIYEQLEFLLDADFSITDIASMLGVSRSTVARRCRIFGLSSRGRISTMDNITLDNNILRLKSLFPNCGYKKMQGLLLREGIRVQRQRLRDAMLRVDPIGVAIRTLQLSIIQRRKYSVPGPNSLWHIDGNHKLIRWNFVIHGGIDGFSRQIVFLRASRSNSAKTVMEYFTLACQEFGLPSRVRSDKGKENTGVALYMLNHPARGPGRGSMITGRSVHNQRIERLWRDVFHGCIYIYYHLFCKMEHDNILEINNERHLYALHYVFTPRINQHLDIFASGWNRHTMSCGNSPRQLWIRGMMTTGDVKIREDMQNIDIDESQYGVDWDPDVISLDASGDVDAIEIPLPPEILNSRQQQQLINSINPLQQSDLHGVDIYLQTLEFVQNLT